MFYSQSLFKEAAISGVYIKGACKRSFVGGGDISEKVGLNRDFKFCAAVAVSIVRGICSFYKVRL